MKVIRPGVMASTFVGEGGGSCRVPDIVRTKKKNGKYPQKGSWSMIAG